MTKNGGCTMKLTFLGHACVFVESDAHRIIIDPFLSGNPLARLGPEEIACEYVIVTHGHGDHLGDTIEIAKKNDAMVISNFEIATYCNQQGVEKIHPMHIGGAAQFPFGRVKLTIAHHGSGFVTENNEIITLGNPAGVLLTIAGKTIYHAGDTGLFYDMKLIGDMNDIDVALLPIGDNFTMGIDDAVKAVEFLQPKLTVPIHYKTFDLIDVDPQEFAGKVSAQGGDVRILDVGDSLVVA